MPCLELDGLPRRRGMFLVLWIGSARPVISSWSGDHDDNARRAAFGRFRDHDIRACDIEIGIHTSTARHRDWVKECDEM